METNPVIIKKTYPVATHKVWKAITDKDQMKEWYFNVDNFVLEEDTAFNICEIGDEKLCHHRCVILEIVPEKKFKHTWTQLSSRNRLSVLTWAIEPAETGGTRLILKYEYLKDSTVAEKDISKNDNEIEWEKLLGTSLNNYLKNK